MSDYVTEEQQIEALKEWWKEYGLSIIIGLVLAIMVIFGWRFYQRYKTNVAERASIVYTRMTVDVLNSQWEDAITQAKLLRKNFARTPYAKIAALTLAKREVSQNDFSNAVAQLKWVTKHASSAIFLQLARLRLARVYIMQDKIKEALVLLQRMKNSALAGLAAEIQGDVYVKLGKIDKAREMYQLALKKIPSSGQSRPVLQMKLDNL